MSRILITGSSDGLGLEAGRQLSADGHAVVLHARNEARAEAARQSLPNCEAVVRADVSTLAGMHALAEQITGLGTFDAVIHNVGVGYGGGHIVTPDGFERIFAVNVVAPFVLTATTPRPRRLIYLSSEMHVDGNPDLSDPMWETRRWNGVQAYCDSKLYDTMLAIALAGRWSDVRVNAVDPGWIATKMGGANAPGKLADGARTQVWLAAGDAPEATVTGGYFHDMRQSRACAAVYDEDAQKRLVDYLERITGISLPD
ncbi:SDR family NAD(P)-dependent oxidoreductase [Novosphingobium mangrovi (ex Huang et al. 2023)]|uniref:SDR family NAD(P)-dependent oxidoreductase n=1 Tax=Novosphingobium mangrovi (ex Huang et al. 2023) TaxID=2976432 RepID=A0ABT2I1S1_9SPHN|nr:SDR family NAD(P)-dependent oxidoreductase [Novosphingobium mangrovi (ex Huang et al. 2023)]MCT2398744.1 SDR family NAD(P)-dependent oxidoreductase [Novosphingobium mangrovi (ex Huang et al. 2023)]